MDQLHCHACDEVMIGQGVILMNDTADGSSWDISSVSIFPNGVQYMLLHPICFEGVWHSIVSTEHLDNAVFTLAYGHVAEIVVGLMEDED